MALQHESGYIGSRPRSKASKKESAFRTHLAVYLGVGAFLLTLNVLTSPFDLWFYWPMFFWGWALVVHAFTTYGADAPARIPDVLRSLLPGSRSASSAPPSTQRSEAPSVPFAAEAFAAVHERIERLKELTWQITDGDVRTQAETFSTEAERRVALMARERTDAAAVRRFDAELLAPAASLLEQYMTAASSDEPNANATAQRIAGRDLPLVIDRLYAEPVAVAPSAPDGNSFGPQP